MFRITGNDKTCCALVTTWNKGDGRDEPFPPDGIGDDDVSWKPKLQQ